MKVVMTFEVDEGVTAEQAYDAAEAMVGAGPVECAVLTYMGTEVR